MSPSLSPRPMSRFNSTNPRELIQNVPDRTEHANRNEDVYNQVHAIPSPSALSRK